MIQKKRENIQHIVYYICACLFFFGNIKLPKMVLSYLRCPLNTTFVSVCIFSILDIILSVYFINLIIHKKTYMHAVICGVINLIYIFPYILHGMWYQIVQYAVFIFPFTICAAIIMLEKDGIESIISTFGQMSQYIVWAFVVYIIMLFVCPPGQYGIVEIHEMSYGDIAYAALPFLFSECEMILRRDIKAKGKLGIRILLYISAVLYTGTRSAMLCMIMMGCLLLFYHYKYVKQIHFVNKVIVLIAISVCVWFCNYITPTGSRLNVVKGNMMHELNKQSINEAFVPENIQIIDNESSADNISGNSNNLDTSNWPVGRESVYNVATCQYTGIEEAFEYYILENTCSIDETEKMLTDDIKNNTQKYIVASDSYRDVASVYWYPINSRVGLWTTAIGEFLFSPLIGNGCLHYQIKYAYTFPHNVVFEILSDFGLVGLGIISLIAILGVGAIIYTAYYEKKHKLMMLLAFCMMYIPMHLLYHSLYFNGILIFTFSIIIFSLLNCILNWRIKKNAIS